MPAGRAGGAAFGFLKKLKAAEPDIFATSCGGEILFTKIKQNSKKYCQTAYYCEINL